MNNDQNIDHMLKNIYLIQIDGIISLLNLEYNDVPNGVIVNTLKKYFCPFVSSFLNKLIKYIK